jgi:signal transduction histidine kinase
MVQTELSVTNPHHLERLLEISRKLNSTLDIATLLQSIIDIACELTSSEAASILLLDPGSGRLRFEAVPGYQADSLKDLSVPIDSSVAGWVYTQAKPLLINDARSDARVYREVDRVMDFETMSILGVPLMINNNPFGVLEAVNKTTGEGYTLDDQAILETLAAQAAIAIENAKLLGRLQDANTELTRLDHMKSDFIAIASHELRTPLGLILGHATFLKELVADEYHEQMDVIIRSAMRLKTIVEDMAAIAHKEEGQSRVRRKQFSMAKLVEDLVTRFQEEAREKKIEIDFDVPAGDQLMADADRDKIEIVVNNLIRNAITFTDTGGQIGIKAESSDDFVKVFVVDTGIGIPPEDAEHIFDRFYQVESHLTRKHGGMGLGLSIAKAMVEMHNGQIWCESKEGVGSLFCFMLPNNQQTAEAASRVFKSS